MCPEHKWPAFYKLGVKCLNEEGAGRQDKHRLQELTLSYKVSIPMLNLVFDSSVQRVCHVTLQINTTSPYSLERAPCDCAGAGAEGVQAGP